MSSSPNPYEPPQEESKAETKLSDGFDVARRTVFRLVAIWLGVLILIGIAGMILSVFTGGG